MKRSIKRVVSGLVVAGFLGIASQAMAADAKLECAVTKDGKTSIHMVTKASECTKLGGKLAQKSKEKAK